MSENKQTQQTLDHNETNRVPALYSPLACVILTLLFTPMFGGFLQGLNWRELGDDERAARSMGWVKWSFVTFATYTVAEPFIDETLIGRYLMIALFVGFWASWTLTMGWDQVRYVKEFVPVYTRKFLGRSVMIGAFGWVAYSAIALTLVLFLHVMGIEKLPDNAPILQNDVPAQTQSQPLGK